MNWSITELKYYAEYVKLTHAKFFDYVSCLCDEDEEEMVSVLLKLIVYNKKEDWYDPLINKEDPLLGSFKTELIETKEKSNYNFSGYY